MKSKLHEAVFWAVFAVVLVVLTSWARLALEPLQSPGTPEIELWIFLLAAVAAVLMVISLVGFFGSIRYLNMFRKLREELETITKVRKTSFILKLDSMTEVVVTPISLDGGGFNFDLSYESMVGSSRYIVDQYKVRTVYGGREMAGRELHELVSVLDQTSANDVTILGTSMETI